MAKSAGGLVTETIASLTSGVSQQAEAVRQPGQLKEIINCLLSPTEGLKTRPPSQIVQNLTPVVGSDLSLAPYERTTQEADLTHPQIIDLTFGLEDPGTQFTCKITVHFGPFLQFFNASYTVQAGDDLPDIADGIAAALNASAGLAIGAVVNMDSTITVTEANNNVPFDLLIERNVTVSAISPSAVFTHVYNRDVDEQYMLIVANGKLTIVDLINRSYPTLTGGTSAYLNTDTPGVSIRALTIDDYTFIINREIVVEEAGTTSTSRDPEALLWVRMGNYGTKYCVTLDGTDYSWYADKFEQRWIDTTKIAQAIANKIPGGRDSAKLVITGTWAIGDTITIKNTAPFGFYSDASAVYTVKADESDPTLVESIHSICVGVAEAWNYAARDAASGVVNAVPVSYDDDFDITDNGVLFYGPTPLQGYAAGYTGSAINITMSATKSSTSGTVAMTNNSTQAATYEVILNGSSLRVRKYNSFVSGNPATSTFQDFTISTHDGLGDQSMRAIKGEVQSIEDLPARGIDGFVCKVTGDESTDKDDFYVVYNDSANVLHDGVWKETLKGGELTSLDATTMPHTLIRNTDGSFTFAAATWNSRLVGDLTTAPFPSFVEQTINEIMFHKNRLGFASQQNTVYSQTANYFNFFRVSVQQLLDEEIIDYGIAATEVAPIRHVVTMQKKVILWSDRAQFTQEGEPLFTAKTIDVNPVTAFECSRRAKPFLLNKDIIFSSDRNNATKIMEFYSSDSGTVNDADDLTALVPSYLKGKPLAICGGPNPGMVFVATLVNMSDIYVYNYVWLNNQLVQSAWSTWRFQDANILSISFLENSLYMVIQRGPIVMLEKIEVLPDDVDNQMADTPSDHLVYLDLRFGTQDFTAFGVTVAYAMGRTTWTFATTLDEAVPHNPLYPMKVVKKATPTDPTTPELPDIQRPDAGKISALGDWRTTDVWIGLQYTQQIELSRLYVREQAEDGHMKSVTDGTTNIHKLHLDYKAGYFTVEVLPLGRSTPYVYEYDGDDEVTEGTFEVPVLNKNTDVQIVIKNASHRPASFTGLTWEGLYQRKTQGKV